jgi:hypothetical protein
MADKLNITELDYQKIKDNLISYFQNVKDDSGNVVYKDYDFKGSALNTLIGILAYNTHYNAMLAHMAVNESFIDSAQLRSSVVSAAKLLGYVPKSSTAGTTSLNISFTRNNTQTTPSSIYLDKNSIFKTTWNNTGFYFVLKDGVSLSAASETPTVYTATNVEVIEGQRVYKRFQVNGVDDAEKYVIDDDDIDISTLVVRVYSNASNLANPSVYSRYSDVTQMASDANLYYLAENMLGRYEISFGNGIISKKLSPLNIIEVEYVVTNGSASNGALGTFTLVSTNSDISNYTSGNSITALSAVAGGSYRENVESVRSNATANFVSQNRAVTADDYNNIIMANFPGAQSVSVWGGENNDPPEYGKVFISVEKTSDSQLSTEPQLNSTDRQLITNLLNGKKVLSIIPEIVDAQYVNIVLDVLFKYNSNLIASTQADFENKIRTQVIADYNDKYLNGFGKIFRHSHFTKTVDNYSSGILNSHVRVFVSKSFDINPDSYDELVLKYGCELTVDDNKAVAAYNTNSLWTLNDEQLYIADRANTNDSDQRILYTYVKYSDGSTLVINNNIGSITLSTGILRINPLGIADSPFKLTVDLIPISDDIVSRRNQLIRINTSRCDVQGYVDEVEVGGLSRSITYQTFKRDR